ncbi:MAG: IS110 family transposase, partial [Pseudomonadota bacterium]
MDAEDKVVLRKTMRRDAVATFFAELPPCLVGMAACSGAHYWAKVLSDLGHEVRLMSPQFVTPYMKSSESDRNDAQAICEAVGRPSMRFGLQKSSDQLALQAVHRIRQRLASDRTRPVNQIRGLLAEHGIAIARDISRLRSAVAKPIEGDNAGLSDSGRELVHDVRGERAELDRRIAPYNRRLKTLFRTDEMCRRIGLMEGIGPVTATAPVAAVGDRTCFKNGTQIEGWAGCWSGVVVFSEVAGLAPLDGVRWRIVANVGCGVSRHACDPPVLARSIGLRPTCFCEIDRPASRWDVAPFVGGGTLGSGPGLLRPPAVGVGLPKRRHPYGDRAGCRDGCPADPAPSGQTHRPACRRRDAFELADHAGCCLERPPAHRPCSRPAP